MYKIAVFVGSLRRDSINRKFARALEKLSQSQFEFHYVELGDVPMYNEDLWENPPASVIRVKNDVTAADAVLFVTPEYNRSIPPVIVNAIAWGSRPRGDNSWAGKPCAIVGASEGAIGTAVCQSHLRSMVAILGVALLGQPEVYFTFKPGLVDENSEITNERTRAFLADFLGKFERWIARS